MGCMREKTANLEQGWTGVYIESGLSFEPSGSIPISKYWSAKFEFTFAVGIDRVESKKNVR